MYVRVGRAGRRDVDVSAAAAAAGLQCREISAVMYIYTLSPPCYHDIIPFCHCDFG